MSIRENTSKLNNENESTKKKKKIFGARIEIWKTEKQS